MIPKIIHYCWLSGDPYPESIQRCIDSWKRVLPDYELILWDTKRFDLSSSQWVKQAFESKKYAFAADYIRMYALYHFGGIYLDSDVEVLKPFDDLLDLPYFLGQEKTPSGIEAATIGCEKGWPMAKLLLDRYDNLRFKGEDGHFDLRALPYTLRRCIEVNYQYNLIQDKTQFNYEEEVVNVFPVDYFSPKDWYNGKIVITPNTYSIHHFAASWMSGNIIKRDGSVRLKEKLSLWYRKQSSHRYKNVAILSNLSLSRYYYDFFFQKPCTPLLNTKVYGEDFVRLLEFLSSESELRLRFIPQHQSKFVSAVYDFYPVGVIDNTDIEIHFIHSVTKDDALKEWETGLKEMIGKRKVVAYVALSKEDEIYYSKVALPKFKITPADKGLKDLRRDNCDSYFWKRMAVMRGIRKKLRRALNRNGI